MLAFGLLNCGVLKVLNASARNCRRRSPFSPSWKFLNSEKSICLVPGPYRILRPELPYTYWAGATKAAASNQRLMERSLDGSTPEATRLGNCEPLAVLSVLVCMVGVKGSPVKRLTMLLNCQPPAINSSGRGAAVRKRLPRPNGNSHDQPAETLCRTSNVELARWANRLR